MRYITVHGAAAMTAGIIAVITGLASVALAIYCVVLFYAAATFEHDSLPGPTVLFMVAVGVGLAAVLCGGVTHLLWTVSKRRRTSRAR